LANRSSCFSLFSCSRINLDLREETSPSALPAFFSISSNFTVWLNKSSVQTSKALSMACIFFWMFLNCSSNFSASSSLAALMSSKWAILASALAVSLESFSIFFLIASMLLAHR